MKSFQHVKSGFFAASARLVLALAPAHAAVLTHQWTLNGTTADTFGGPSMVLPDPTGLLATGYDYDANEGPNVSNAITFDNYSIEMRVSFDILSGYRKIIDFKNRSTDQGLYFLNGQANFYSFTGNVGPVYPAGSMLHLVATRNSGTNQFNFYVNGTSVMTMADASGAAKFTGPGAIVHLLRDDLATSGEHGPGFLDYVKFYDGALTASEVAALAPTESNISAPAPAALALLGLGMMGIGLVRRRRLRLIGR